jgi:tripartite-type tricarboxylate transporter receptor subunit TctC
MKKSCLIIATVLLLSMCGTGNCGAAGENYPLKPITVIIPMEAGSDADILWRPMLQKVSVILGKPVIAVNKPGAGHSLGYREVYGANPDGYTLGATSVSIVLNKLLGLLRYDHRDFTLLGKFSASYPIIIGSTKTQRPFGTIQEVFSFAKLHPGEVSYACTAVGGSYWVATMLVQEGTGLKFNIIPQEGSAGFVVGQVAGGHTDIGVSGWSAAKAQIAAKNVRPLAVIGPERDLEEFQNTPTLKEVGYDISFDSFSGLIGPPKMPKNIADKLIKAFEMAGNDPEYKKFLVSRIMIPSYLSPEGFFSFCEEKRRAYRIILDKAGLLKEK